MLKTERLLLRQWAEDDFLPFAEMCSDKDVMEFFPKLQTQSESYEMAKKIQALIEGRGWGLWALEIPNQHRFIGFVGLHIPKDNMPWRWKFQINIGLLGLSACISPKTICRFRHA